MIPSTPAARLVRARRLQRPAGFAVLAAALTPCFQAWLAPAWAAAVKVTVPLPMPQKIPTENIRTILVAKFVATDNSALDANREMVAFLKRELARGTDIQVLDVDPPNLPEQTPEDLIRNATFWQHIAEENGADLVVSGRVSFGSYDRSGFVQEDNVSPVTGQKVRQTVYAERESFELSVNLWFFKGANGALLYEDSFKQAQLFEGKANDALQAFFDLVERLKPDILGVLVPQTREDPRTIFTD